MKLELIVETSYFQISYPVIVHNISCIIGNFCKKNGATLPIKFDEISFDMNVQSLERTFLRRPELLEKTELSEKDKKILAKIKEKHSMK